MLGLDFRVSVVVKRSLCFWDPIIAQKTHAALSGGRGHRPALCWACLGRPGSAQAWYLPVSRVELSDRQCSVLYKSHRVSI